MLHDLNAKKDEVLNKNMVGPVSIYTRLHHSSYLTDLDLTRMFREFKILNMAEK